MIIKMNVEVIIDITEEEFDMFVESGDKTILFNAIKSSVLEIVDENNEDIFEIGKVDVSDNVQEILSKIEA